MMLSQFLEHLINTDLLHHLMKIQGEQTDATDNTVLFIVINACGVQLLPATVIALRAQAGSAAPADVLTPTVISTLVTAAIGVTLCFLKRSARGKGQGK